MRPTLFPLALVAALIIPASLATALELSLTITGDIDEIKAVLEFIEQRNLVGEGGSENPLKFDVHSMVEGGEIQAQPAPAARPVVLSTPQLNGEKLIPGQAGLVTIAVLDDRKEVDTLALHVTGTNLSGDLFDDGTHGDEVANDDVWSVLLTPMEITPAGRYDLVVQGFDRHGHALLVPGTDGEEQHLQVRTEILIER